MLIKELYGEGVQASGPVQNPVRQAPAAPDGAPGAPLRYAAQQQPASKPEGEKRKKWKTIAIVGGGAVAVYLIILLAVGGFGAKNGTAKQEISAVQTQAPAIATVGQTVPEPAEATQPPNPSELNLTMDYGQIYECDVRDFDMDYGYTNAQVDWNCNGDIDQVYCSEDGVILAGNVQTDPAAGYNDAIQVVGTAPNGVEYVYNVTVGNGSTYQFGWSSGPRVLKDCTSYTYVPTPAVPNCIGFTLHYRYTLDSGTIKGSWIVWVHEDNGKWIDACVIDLESGVEKAIEVTLDHPVNITEVVIQPVTQYQDFSCTEAYGVSNLIFQVGE
ncbi:hypothetical protein SDC9_125222 [bioreactor metagenome]|uniref:Uncharacterized protein n=1 Tax=bioreactor metagenome TaxID=1076179 RepID=A0A645CMP3_9ZZZZ